MYRIYRCCQLTRNRCVCRRLPEPDTLRGCDHLMTSCVWRIRIALYARLIRYTPSTRWSWLDELALRARRAHDERSSSARRAGLMSWLPGHLNGVILQTFTKLLVERSSSQLHRVNGVLDFFRFVCRHCLSISWSQKTIDALFRISASGWITIQ